MSIVHRTNIQPLVRALKQVIDQTDELEANTFAGLKANDISGLITDIGSINNKLNPILGAVVPNQNTTRTIIRENPDFSGGLSANRNIIDTAGILKTFDCNTFLSCATASVATTEYVRTDFYDSSGAVPDPSDSLLFSLIHTTDGYRDVGNSVRVKQNNHTIDCGAGIVFEKGITLVCNRTDTGINFESVAVNIFWDSGLPEYNYNGIVQEIADLWSIVGAYEP